MSIELIPGKLYRLGSFTNFYPYENDAVIYLDRNEVVMFIRQHYSSSVVLWNGIKGFVDTRLSKIEGYPY